MYFLLADPHEQLAFQGHSYSEVACNPVHLGGKCNIFDRKSKRIDEDDVACRVSTRFGAQDDLAKLSVDAATRGTGGCTHWLRGAADIAGIVRADDLSSSIHSPKQAMRVVLDKRPIIDNDLIRLEDDLRQRVVKRNVYQDGPWLQPLILDVTACRRGGGDDELGGSDRLFWVSRDL